jgi:hypothetical protein
MTVADLDLADERWRTGEARSCSASRTLVFLPPTRWISFAGGRDSVYALRRRASESVSLRGIDRINERGESEPFLVSESVYFWDEFHVVELGKRTFLVGHDAGGPPQIGEASEAKAGGVREMIPLAPLGLPSPLPYGALAAVPTREPGTPDGWAVVWIESALPAPTGAAPPNHLQAPPEPRTTAPLEERLHVTRFDGKKKLDDRVVLSKPRSDEPDPLLVRPTDRGLEINGTTYDSTGKIVSTRALSTPPFAPGHMTPDEQLIASSYDDTRQEGAVVYWSGDRARWREFNRLGRPSGPSKSLGKDYYRSDYSGYPPLAPTSNGWWMWNLVGGQMLSLDHGTLVPEPRDGALEFFPENEPAFLLKIQDSLMAVQHFSAKTGKFSGDSTIIAGVQKDWIYIGAISGNGFEPALLALHLMGDEQRLFLQKFVVSQGAWHEIMGAMPESIGKSYEQSLHRVWGDFVLRAEGEFGIALTWLGAGQTRVFLGGASELAPLVREQGRGRLLGPLLAGGPRMIPPRPGPLIDTPELQGIDVDCEQIMPTAPGVLSLICTEALFRDKPGTRVGIRTFRFRE